MRGPQGVSLPSGRGEWVTVGCVSLNLCPGREQTWTPGDRGGTKEPVGLPSSRVPRSPSVTLVGHRPRRQSWGSKVPSLSFAFQV